MAKYIGRKIQVGFGKESSRGTAVAASQWQPQTSLDFDEKVEYAKNEAGHGTIFGQRDGVVVTRWGEGNINGLVYDKPFGMILLSLLGTVNSAAKAGGNSSVYDHTFTLQESAQRQSLTIATDEANGDYRFANAVIDELSINYELGKIVEFESKFLSVKGASATNSPSLATDAYFFRPQDFSFKHATDTAGLSGASATAVQSFKLTFSANAEPDKVLGSTDPRDFVSREFAVTGEVGMVYEAETMKNYALQGTKRAMEISLVNTGVTIGASANPGLVITLDEVVFDDYSREKALGDLVMVTLPFSANYLLSAARFGNVVLTNLQASY
jgi:hypothetical protein